MTLKKARFLFLAFLLLHSFSLSLVPGHNGDMPFYIAAVFSMQGATDQDALSQAAAVIRAELPAKEAAVHISRLKGSEKGLMDFYKIKPAYVYAVAGLHRLGIPFIPATLIPSLISFFLIGCLVFSWASKVLDALPALVFSLALMLINPVIILARLSSPDALSNLFLFGSFYRIYFRKGRGWTVFLLLCALFIRLDNLLAALVLLTLMRCLPSRDGQAVFPPAAYLLSILLICAAGIWINYYFESDFSWYRRIGYIQSPSSYGLQVLVYFLSLSQSFFMALLLLCLLVLFKGRLHRRTAQAYILLGIAAIFFLRFVLFPSFEERFQAAFYLPATLILLELLLSESGKGLPGGRYGPEPAG